VEFLNFGEPPDTAVGAGRRGRMVRRDYITESGLPAVARSDRGNAPAAKVRRGRRRPQSRAIFVPPAPAGVKRVAAAGQMC